MIQKCLYDKNIVVLDERSLQVGGAWMKQGVYDPKLIAFMAEQMGKVKNPVLVDVGASTGSFALLPKFVGGEVIALEPNPEIFLILCMNLKLNGLLERSKTFQLAAHAYNGEVGLNIPNKPSMSGLATIGDPKRFKGHRQITVSCKKLDSLKLGRVNFLKIDTEGAEGAVLAGATRLIKSNRPKILIEHNKTNAEQCNSSLDLVVDHLKGLGYKNFRRVGREDLWIT